MRKSRNRKLFSNSYEYRKQRIENFSRSSNEEMLAKVGSQRGCEKLLSRLQKHHEHGYGEYDTKGEE